MDPPILNPAAGDAAHDHRFIGKIQLKHVEKEKEDEKLTEIGFGSAPKTKREGEMKLLRDRVSKLKSTSSSRQRAIRASFLNPEQ
ncbi:hypothetical protein L3X38_005687 [Prunus dulcis]|uniref:Uncharacterized protein n=1 Tax=Prunus dulcis TaxID=3755 RepID=A0AAD4ZR98_PRUDU|nr:hypothetical protein L3X38_005687 [Prunus dulcis]